MEWDTGWVYGAGGSEGWGETGECEQGECEEQGEFYGG